MAKFKKGDKKPANSGRKAGQQTKYPTELKEMILEALHRAGGQGEYGEAGGVVYLRNQAVDNPVAFMSLLGRVLPMTVMGTGKDGEFVIQIQSNHAKVF